VLKAALADQVKAAAPSRLKRHRGSRGQSPLVIQAKLEYEPLSAYGDRGGRSPLVIQAKLEKKEFPLP